MTWNDTSFGARDIAFGGSILAISPPIVLLWMVLYPAIVPSVIFYLTIFFIRC